MKTAGLKRAIIGKPDAALIKRHLDSSFEQVAMRTDKMSFDHIQSLRKLSADVFREMSVTGGTRREVSKELMQRAMEIPGFEFTDKSGRKWKNKSYFAMLARTELMNAGRESFDQTMAKEGFDIVILDYSGESCEHCSKWEGKIFSLTGATPGIPTKADLEADGVFHPNCTHSYSALSDYSLAEMGYDIRQPATEDEDYAKTDEIDSNENTKLAISGSPQIFKKRKDAIEFAKKNIADEVDYTGLELKTINKLNSSLYDKLKKYGVEKFNSISPGDGIFGVSRDNRIMQFNADAVNEIVNNPRSAYRKYVTKYIHQGKKRHFAVDSNEEIFRHLVSHETGHMVFNKSKLVNKDEKLNKIYERHKNDSWVSAYALRNGREFFAEAFAVYEKDGILNDEIRDLIKEVLE